MSRWPPLLTGLGVVVLVAAAARAELPKLKITTPPPLPASSSQLDGPSPHPSRPPTKTAHPGSHGNTIAVDEFGVLVVERSAGKLIRADREGKPLAALALTPGLGELVHGGPERVFVADRAAGRVVRVNPGDASGDGLAEVAAQDALGEPHGLALTPGGRPCS